MVIIESQTFSRDLVHYNEIEKLEEIGVVLCTKEIKESYRGELSFKGIQAVIAQGTYIDEHFPRMCFADFLEEEYYIAGYFNPKTDEYYLLATKEQKKTLNK
ncbi:MAG: hypothetical protein QNJ54_06620 [Prochloraceae cyanobacterium]|nr:hypothetical protein [Prochloraceae cyanobacterium]